MPKSPKILVPTFDKVSCVRCCNAYTKNELWGDGLCFPCAREEDLVQPMNNIEETERLEAEHKRIAEEEAAVFNLERETQKELAERAVSRRRLLPFITRINPDYIPGWVHADICQRLEQFAIDIEEGNSPRLMITMPPRHGKSEIGSKTFPSWYLGRNPKHEVITCSYSGDLAKDFSRKCRDLIDSDKYKTTFKTRLSKDSKSVEKWSTSTGGGFTAAGVQGPITGRGAHLGIIDDPVKDREEAESETTRQKIKDWYSSTFYTRLAPGGGILIIQTRWHDDDLAGWLLNVMAEATHEMNETGEWPEDADRWQLVEYPAVATEDEDYRKKGEPLHEDRYPLKALNRIKRTMIPRDWEALYQQRPVSEDGDYFKSEDFRYYVAKDRPPLKEMRIYSACDLAISKKQTADYTVFITVGISRSQDIYVLDLRRGRWGALGITEEMFDIQTRWNPEIFGMEDGQIALTLEDFIQKVEQEKGITLRYEKLKTRGVDKVTRARTIQGRIEQHKVFFPTVESTPWMSSFINELLKFPLGKNDDQVDALAWVGRMIMLFGIVNQKKPKKEKSWRDKLTKYGIRDPKHRTGMSA